MKILYSLLLILLSVNTIAAEIPQATKKEVGHLLQYLENSGCQFNRNNSWHTASEAVEHINTKYEYLLEKGKITTTESFIEMAATKSSMSGKQYEVKCENQPAIPSSIWFNTELNNLRKLENT